MSEPIDPILLTPPENPIADATEREPIHEDAPRLDALAEDLASIPSPNPAPTFPDHNRFCQCISCRSSRGQHV